MRLCQIGRVYRLAARLFRWSVGPALLIVLPGCASYDAYRARFREPDYIVTKAFYTQAPRRVAVLPFATRSQRERDLEKAQVCRVAFYQHFSVRDFEDVDMQALDRRLLPAQRQEADTLFHQFVNTVRKLDFVGLTSVLDLKSYFEADQWECSAFRTWVKTAYQELKADAYMLGITRGYGRLYAVAFSSIAMATRLELRSTADDALLWRADYRKRQVSLPLTINPLDIPFLLYGIWKDSRGEELDLLAFRVYRDIVKTIPSVESPSEVLVQARRPRTRVYHAPTIWRLRRRGFVAEGTTFPFLMEKRGWYQCVGPEGQPLWLFRREARLVNEKGQPFGTLDPIAGLWAPPPPPPIMTPE